MCQVRIYSPVQRTTGAEAETLGTGKAKGDNLEEFPSTGGVFCEKYSDSRIRQLRA